VALRAAGPAIEAFEQAVTLNSSLTASWRSLSVLYRMAGREEHAKRATEKPRQKSRDKRSRCSF